MLLIGPSSSFVSESFLIWQEDKVTVQCVRGRVKMGSVGAEHKTNSQVAQLSLPNAGS